MNVWHVLKNSVYTQNIVTIHEIWAKIENFYAIVDEYVQKFFVSKKIFQRHSMSGLLLEVLVLPLYIVFGYLLLNSFVLNPFV